jgi:hypothetical protein
MTEENSPQWEPPPPPEKIVEDPAQMSEPATLASVFFEPGRVFEDIRRKPRFVLAGLIIIIAATTFNIAFIQKVGFEAIIRDRIESSSRTADLSKEQKETIIQQQSGPIVKAISYGAVPIVLTVIFFLGGLIYWLGANAMGGTTSYLRGVSVWVYSSLPPTILFVAANLIVLLLKSVDDIDIGRAQGGLIQANPSMFINAKAMPVVAALLGSLDFFAIWGWILAAIGLQKVAKISSGAAWAVVLLLALLGVGMKVIGALLFS